MQRIESLLPPEVIARLKRLHFGGTRAATGGMVGKYLSAFRGSGLTFAELREYTPGDEIRTIDWKASARSTRVFVKSYEEERQLQIMIAIDVSHSCFADLIPVSPVQFGALVAYLAQQGHDLCGITTFGSEVVNYVKPCSKKNHWNRLGSLLHSTTSVASNADVNIVCQTLQSRLRAKTTVFILSDFYCSPYMKGLRRLSSRHDVTLVHFCPEIDTFLPPSGLVRIGGAEEETSVIVDSSSKQSRKAIMQRIETHAEETKTCAQQSGARYIRINDDCAAPFFSYLSRRSIR